jgi:hypothetical protein
MSKLKHRPAVGWKGSLSLGFIVAALLTLNMSCNRAEPDQRAAILENQAKMLIISEAQQGFEGIFKTNFNPDKTRLLLGADLQKWFQEHPKSLRNVPEPIKESIKNNQGAGLLIEGGRPDKGGGNQDVVYLRPPRFGIRRFFVFANPDPCGDGNPATCEFCSGCSGESSPGGTIGSCVCTETCGTCAPCPGC